MSRECLKCGNYFPRHIWVEGKYKNLQHRKYCLICSPFGKRNTKRLHISKCDKETLIRNIIEQTGESYEIVSRRFLNCVICDRPLSPKRKNGKKCYNCIFQKRCNTIRDKVYGIVGETCWCCGYSKGKIGRSVLDFHHMDRTSKSFSISRLAMTNFKWSRVWIEMKKCALLCCRCHREVEYNIIPSSEIIEIYQKRWLEIDLKLQQAHNSVAEPTIYNGVVGGSISSGSITNSNPAGSIH